MQDVHLVDPHTIERAGGRSTLDRVEHGGGFTVRDRHDQLRARLDESDHAVGRVGR